MMKEIARTGVTPEAPYITLRSYRTDKPSPTAACHAAPALRCSVRTSPTSSCTTRPSGDPRRASCTRRLGSQSS